jgi:hypothetical protein
MWHSSFAESASRLLSRWCPVPPIREQGRFTSDALAFGKTNGINAQDRQGLPGGRSLKRLSLGGVEVK